MFTYKICMIFFMHKLTHHKNCYIWVNINQDIMNLIIRILLTAVLVMVIAHFMPGVALKGTHGLSSDNFVTAIIVAVVLGLLNLFVKPILVLLTLPVTLITFGLFLLVINALIIMLCANLVDGFAVSSFWTALLFSLILSVLQSVLFSLTGGDK